VAEEVPGFAALGGEFAGFLLGGFWRFERGSGATLTFVDAQNGAPSF
jgi:hypothetical protein